MSFFQGSNTSTGMPSKSTFDDLLDQNLFTNKNKPDDNSTPLNSLQGKKKIEQITDPDQRKVTRILCIYNQLANLKHLIIHD